MLCMHVLICSQCDDHTAVLQESHMLSGFIIGTICDGSDSVVKGGHEVTISVVTVASYVHN